MCIRDRGIDLLGAQTDEYLTVKQCASVAHQYDRSMTISEAYGCTGWELDFSTQKWLGDWQFALGITTVSYTHLDVYKRQAPCRAIVKIKLRKSTGRQVRW